MQATRNAARTGIRGYPRLNCLEFKKEIAHELPVSGHIDVKDTIRGNRGGQCFPGEARNPANYIFGGAGNSVEKILVQKILVQKILAQKIFAQKIFAQKILVGKFLHGGC
jgi:hypothetical protein